MRPFSILNLTFIFSLFFNFQIAAEIENEDAPSIAKSTACEKILGPAISLLMSSYTEPIIVAASFYRSLQDRCKVKKLTEETCYASESDFISFSQFSKLGNRLDVTKEIWVPKSMSFPKYGAPVTFAKAPGLSGPISILQHHLKTEVPKPYSDIALKTMEAFLNYPQVIDWMKTIREEALQEMWDAGLRGQIHLESHAVREYYLDLVLARRAKAKGFKVKSNGLPHNMITFSTYAFQASLALGHLFIDWTGTAASSSADDSDHFARGHLLAMAYAADHVPNFVDLTKYIGRTNDYRGIWGQMFDNVYSTDTPFWGGFWVSQFKDYLGIHY